MDVRKSDKQSAQRIRPAARRTASMMESLHRRIFLSVTLFGQPPTLSDPDNSQSVAVADLNGDGKADVIAANKGNGVSVYLGNGDGTFQAPVIYDQGSSLNYSFSTATIADVNGDGIPDIIATSQDDQMDVLIGNG